MHVEEKKFSKHKKDRIQEMWKRKNIVSKEETEYNRAECISKK